MFSVDTFPSNETAVRKVLKKIMQALQTFHNDLNIADKTMDHTQGLRNGDPSFVLRQPIQSLKNSLYLALPQQLLREFFCEGVTLSSG